ncbi:hypothetical protein F441_20496 [Phytophthora nicotianae CJ01A1]|uniref:Uncharacterized protein n=2 Tax=Phytophthora nicotianae TaxID=4792 RepID=W2VXG2_PHYNI|nr:hypothetical protein F444_20643 [Phytophthora nicotianae P1976]ETP02428.1 hypothetical protein F441_20496 [Phytophthora nicotianae CJ01A1]
MIFMIPSDSAWEYSLHSIWLLRMASVTASASYKKPEWWSLGVGQGKRDVFLPLSYVTTEISIVACAGGWMKIRPLVPLIVTVSLILASVEYSSVAKRWPLYSSVMELYTSTPCSLSFPADVIFSGSNPNTIVAVANT